MNLVIPAELRVCRKHGLRACPSDRRNGNYFRCSRCRKERRKRPEISAKRLHKWVSTFIGCTKHPNRVCRKHDYICRGRKVCNFCKRRDRNGSLYPCEARYKRMANYNKSIELRKHLRGRLRGLKLFERSTGFNLEQLGFTRKEINAHN